MICTIPLSFLIFPISLTIASLNVHFATIITIAWIWVVTWVDVICKRYNLHPKYFSVCALSSIISVWILLQYSPIHKFKKIKIEYFVFNLSMLTALIFFNIVSDFELYFLLKKKMWVSILKYSDFFFKSKFFSFFSNLNKCI